jgi:hypothetical protein
MRNTANRASDDRSPNSDPELTAALSAMYTAPADDSYWQGLEGRIMARIKQADAQGEWWSVFAEWRMAGLVAAGLMLTLAGAALWQDYQIDRDIRKIAAGAALLTVFDENEEDVTIAISVPTSRPSQGGSASRYLFTAEP